MGDIFSGQERNILVKLNGPTQNLGKHQLLAASFEFTDIIKNKQPVSLIRELTYEVTQDKSKVAANENKKVTARGVSVDAASELYRATMYYEQGNRDDALNNIKRALGMIVQLNSSPQKSAATMKQEAELRDAMEEMAATASAPESDAGKKLIKEYKAKSREQQK